MIKFVVCVWNAENYIKNCIKTLLNHKDTNFEVYIIDDVSTDKTVETTKTLIKDDQRFHLIVNQEKKFKLRILYSIRPTFKKIGCVRRTK